MTAVLSPKVLSAVNLEKPLDQQRRGRQVRRSQQLALLKGDLCVVVRGVLECYTDIVTYELLGTRSNLHPAGKCVALWGTFTTTCERKELLYGRVNHLLDCATLLGLLDDLYNSVRRLPDEYAGPEAHEFLAWLATVLTFYVEPLVAQLRPLDDRNEYRYIRASWIR